MVQLYRSATGSDNSGMAIRSTASLFTDVRPDATVAFAAPTPPSMKSQRQPNPIFSHAERFGNPTTRPTRLCQHLGSGTIRLAAIS